MKHTHSNHTNPIVMHTASGQLTSYYQVIVVLFAVFLTFYISSNGYFDSIVKKGDSTEQKSSSEKEEKEEKEKEEKEEFNHERYISWLETLLDIQARLKSETPYTSSAFDQVMLEIPTPPPEC